MCLSVRLSISLSIHIYLFIYVLVILTSLHIFDLSVCLSVDLSISSVSQSLQYLNSHTASMGFSSFLHESELARQRSCREGRREGGRGGSETASEGLSLQRRDKAQQTRICCRCVVRYPSPLSLPVVTPLITCT